MVMAIYNSRFYCLVGILHWGPTIYMVYGRGDSGGDWWNILLHISSNIKAKTILKMNTPVKHYKYCIFIEL